jgi:hypothetical protein
MKYNIRLTLAVSTVVAAAVFGLALLATSLAHGKVADAAYTYNHIYWMSAASYNLDGDPAIDFCVQQSYHGGNHVDVNADDTGDADPCYIVNSNSIYVTGRTRAYIPSGVRTIANVYVTSGAYTDGCDYVEGRTTSVADGGRFRGTERWIHAHSYGTVPYTYGISANTSGTQQISSLGNAMTTQDTNCGGGWTGQHVHQGNNNSSCNYVDSLAYDVTPPLPDVWTLGNYINRFYYIEGSAAC